MLYSMSTTETLGPGVNVFRATIKAVKTNEWCNLKLFWYLYCYNWTNFTLFFFSSSSSSSSQICIFDFEYKIANEIKRTLAKSYFYTIQNQLMGVVFEIATSRHWKFSVKKGSATLLKRDSNTSISCEICEIFMNTYSEFWRTSANDAFWIASLNIPDIPEKTCDMKLFSFQLMI